jgi:hypothetical protein
MNKLLSYKITRNFLLVVALLFIVFISIWVRAFTGSMKDYLKGRDLLVEAQDVQAVTYFDRAMHWYTPFNPYVERSAEYLWKISEKAEKTGDYILAKIAVESIRSSFYGSRSFYTPGKNWIAKCDERISSIVQNYDDKIFSDSSINSKLQSDYVIATVYNDPDIFWTIILEIGLFGWIGATIGFIHFCISKEIKPDTFIFKHWFWISIACICYGLWISGMIKT